MEMVKGWKCTVPGLSFAQPPSDGRIIIGLLPHRDIHPQTASDNFFSTRGIRQGQLRVLLLPP